MDSTDVTKILAATCYTSAGTASGVCKLLESAISEVHRLSAEAEALQSRRRGDPGTGHVEAIYYIPDGEVSHFCESGIPFPGVPNFLLAEARISQQS